MPLSDPAPKEDFAPERFRAGDWHGRVVAGYDSTEEEAELDDGRTKPVTRLERVYVFDRQGNVEEVYEDVLIFASVLRGQFASAPDVVGRLQSRKAPYSLEPLGDPAKVARVEAALEAYSSPPPRVSQAARDRVADRERGPVDDRPANAPDDQDAEFVRPAPRPNPRSPRPRTRPSGEDAF